MGTSQTRELIDEFLWLEEIHDDRALVWVTEQNERTEQMLATPTFSKTEHDILEVLDSDDRIPMVSRAGQWYYNFWKDAEHPRGLWRRTTLESYRRSEPDWEIVLDIDDLGRREGTAWVWEGVEFLYPSYDRALVNLSPDGGDATVVREFNLCANEFVGGGFELALAKSWFGWIDSDTIFVATDFGPDTLTTSGYPRQIRRWTRGTNLLDAPVILEVPDDHMLANFHYDHSDGHEKQLILDVIDFFHARRYVLEGSELTLIKVPDHAIIETHRDWLLIHPREEWSVSSETYPAGSLLAAKFTDYVSGSRNLTVLFTPDAHTSLNEWSWTKDHLLLNLLYDVSSRIEVLTPGDAGWQRQSLKTAPALHSASAHAVDADESNDYWLVVDGFLTPAQLKLGDASTDSAETLKSAPSFFEASKYSVEQHFAISKDGTRIPYFQVASRELRLDGNNPTFLTGYGGFEVPLTPDYIGTTGRAWLDRGGVYVRANIRGGGEYGPDWHTAALKANRHRAYEDFAAVAQDLIDRGVTSPPRLGCEGGSNGGLLVGNMLTHYPQLFGTIACLVPLLDMRRYTKLSAGASWIAEYGDPDIPEQWEFIQAFSPYHNLKAGTDYPPVLFYTATSDDRVGPVQARKMAARMQSMGISDVWFYENREGGHGAAADNKQAAHLQAAAFEFLWMHLGSNSPSS